MLAPDSYKDTESCISFDGKYVEVSRVDLKRDKQWLEVPGPVGQENLQTDYPGRDETQMKNRKCKIRQCTMTKQNKLVDIDDWSFRLSAERNKDFPFCKYIVNDTASCYCQTQKERII